MARKWVEGALLVGIPLLMVVSLFGMLGIVMGGHIGSPVDSATYHGQVESVEEDRGYVFEKNEVTVVHGDDADARADFCVVGDRADEKLETFRSAADSGQDVTVEYFSPAWVSPTDCSGASGGTIKIVSDVRISGGDADA